MKKLKIIFLIAAFSCITSAQQKSYLPNSEAVDDTGYYFVLNASENGAEPHWNVPGNSGAYIETGDNWLSSSPHPVLFADINAKARANINAANNPVAIYSFILPDSLEGEYFIDASFNPFSSNSYSSKVAILSGPDSNSATFNSHGIIAELYWIRIGDSSQTFYLHSGLNKIKFYEVPNAINLDLLRIRKALIISDINDADLFLPGKFELYQNYPNPFNPFTSISFYIPEQAEIKLSIVDMLGREVISLIDGIKNVGNHTIDFNAENFPSGIYFYNLQFNGQSLTRKMVLLK